MTPQMDRANLLDVVALTIDLPERGLRRGQVGTVVLVHDSERVEVEFATSDGRTYALATLPRERLLVLHYDPLQVA